MDELLAAQAQFCKHGRPSCNGYKYADRLRGWGDNITIPGIEQRFSTYRDRDRDLRRHQELLLASRIAGSHLPHLFFIRFSLSRPLALSLSLSSRTCRAVSASRAAETVRATCTLVDDLSLVLSPPLDLDFFLLASPEWRLSVGDRSPRIWTSGRKTGTRRLVRRSRRVVVEHVGSLATFGSA